MKKIITFILPLFVLALMSCSGSDSKQKAASAIPETDTLRNGVVVAHPRVSLPDTTGTVKGYETHKYSIPVESNGIYSVTTSSDNTGLIFVIQDAHGNNVVDESTDWKGELKKGDYTLIVGLMRNAARNNQNNEVKYTIKVEREK